VVVARRIDIEHRPQIPAAPGCNMKVRTGADGDTGAAAHNLRENPLPAKNIRLRFVSRVVWPPRSWHSNRSKIFTLAA
jgi:hypothetical protein